MDWYFFVLYKSCTNKLGGVPLELCCLVNQPADSIKKKVESYLENRAEDLAYDHEKFCKTLSDDGLKNLKECISRMTLGLAPPQTKTGMDRQIFDIILDNNGHKIITALTPLARIVMVSHHGDKLLTPLSMVAEIILSSSDYTNDVKGRVLEKYLLATMEIIKSFSFEFKEFGGISPQSKKYLYRHGFIT